MDTKELVIVVDFGGQYNQLIARRVRENHVYCEVYPYHKAVAKIKELQPQASSLRAAPAVFTKTMHRRSKKKSSSSASLSSVSATACSSWPRLRR